jgi:hypothetical protein
MFSHDYLGRGIDAELQLGSLPIIDGETLHEQGGEPGPRPAAKRVEDQEALRGKLKYECRKEFHPTWFIFIKVLYSNQPVNYCAGEVL